MFAAQVEAFAMNPGFITKDRDEAEKIAAEANEIADEGEEYVVFPYQANRFVVGLVYNGKVEIFL